MNEIITRPRSTTKMEPAVPTQHHHKVFLGILKKLKAKDQKMEVATTFYENKPVSAQLAIAKLSMSDSLVERMLIEHANWLVRMIAVDFFPDLRLDLTLPVSTGGVSWLWDFREKFFHHFSELQDPEMTPLVCKYAKCTSLFIFDGVLVFVANVKVRIFFHFIYFFADAIVKNNTWVADYRAGTELIRSALWNLRVVVTEAFERKKQLKVRNYSSFHLDLTYSYS